MPKKLQVFVSSTYTDMKAERQAVIEAILLAGHIPAGMELFAAGDESQLDVIKQWIQDSDAFVLILGGRYGTVEQTSGKSYIQLEYEHAISNGKPFFAAVIDDDYLKQKIKESENPSDGMERENYKAYIDFKEQVKSKMCRFFKTLEGLKMIVMESLRRIEQTKELVGWVRADSVQDTNPLIEQLKLLQETNRDLRKQFDEAQEQASAPPFHGYEFQEVYEALDEAAILTPDPLRKQFSFPVKVTALEVFWNNRKLYCAGIRAAGPSAVWLAGPVSDELLSYGLVKRETTTEYFTPPFGGPQRTESVAYATITDLGRRFLSMVDRDEDLKLGIASTGTVPSAACRNDD